MLCMIYTLDVSTDYTVTLKTEQDLENISSDRRNYCSSYNRVVPLVITRYK